MRRFQFSLRILLAAVTAVAVVVGIGLWLQTRLAAKENYDKARDALLYDLPPYVLVTMDDDDSAFLGEVRANWTEQYSDVGGPHTDALESIGMHATVKNVAALFTYRIPAYSFVSQAENNKARAIGAIQAVIVPITTDDVIHVSSDGHVAFTRTTSNSILVFSDEPNGLREARYSTMQDKTALESEGDPHSDKADKTEK